MRSFNVIQTLIERAETYFSINKVERKMNNKASGEQNFNVLKMTM